MPDKKRPTEGAPGDSEIQQTCDNARKIVELCDALGFEFRGGAHLVGLLEGAEHINHHHPAELHVSLDAMIEDPDLRPYIWDLEE
jgi:hypothetical protein